MERVIKHLARCDTHHPIECLPHTPIVSHPHHPCVSQADLSSSSPRSAILPSPRALGIPVTVSPINISRHAGTPLSAPRSRAASSHAHSTGRKDASDGMVHATSSGNVEDAPAVPSAISAFQARISAELERAGLHAGQESQEILRPNKMVHAMKTLNRRS